MSKKYRCASRKSLASLTSVIAFAAIVLGWTTATAAQDTSVGSPQLDAQPVCNVFLRDDEGRVVASDETLPDGGFLTATCGGRGYQLGRADGFVMMPHRETGAVVVVQSRENDRKVWLFSRRDGGGIALEDLTHELARAVGRSASSNLVDIRVNLARFRSTGVIAAVPAGRPEARSATAAEVALDARLPRVVEAAQ